MTRRRALGAVRGIFLLAALALATCGFRGRWGEVGEAAVGTGPARVAGAVAAATTGILLTAALWRLLLRWVGSEVAVREAASVFLVGQLGKYVPGTVWNIVAQAQLARRHGVPVRSSTTASLLFLLVHTSTGLVVGALLVLAGAADLPDGIRPAWAYVALLLGAAALTPAVLRPVADRLAGPDVTVDVGTARLLGAVALMGAVWVLYGCSTLLLLPHVPGAPGLLGVTAAFALAHALGVLVVVAPAGVGAREAVLVALLSPTVGVPVAVAAALLSRAAHALADFLAAGVALGWAAAAPAPCPVAGVAR